MAISSAHRLPLRSLAFSLALVLAACSSDGGGDTLGGGRIDDPEPSAGGAPSSEPEPSEAGAAPVEPDPGAAGEGGQPGSSEPEPEPQGGAPSEPEPEPGAGGRSGEEPEPEPEPPSEAELRGEALVEKNGCVTCHQANFAGFSVFPNITPDMKTGIGSWTDEQIIKAIRDGVDADGASMCPTMARYPFTDDEVADVVAFLRGLPPVAAKIASACPGHG